MVVEMEKIELIPDFFFLKETEVTGFANGMK